MEGSGWSSDWRRLGSVAEVLTFVGAYPDICCFYKECRIEARATLSFIVRGRLSELGYELGKLVDITGEPSDH